MSETKEEREALALATKWQDLSRQRTVTLGEIVEDVLAHGYRKGLEAARDQSCKYCRQRSDFHGHSAGDWKWCSATVIRGMLRAL